MQVFFVFCIVCLLVSKSLALNVKSTDNRIYKGVAAEVGQFPFMIFILNGIYQAPGRKAGSCTGSLIKFDTVLTAGHCLYNEHPYYEYKPGNVVVLAGKVDALDYALFRLRNPMNATFTETPVTYQESMALQLFIHPNKRLDVGIVKLKNPFKKTQYVNTIPYTTEEYTGKITCYILGFGQTNLNISRRLFYFTTNNVKNSLKQCGAEIEMPEYYCYLKAKQSTPSGCSGDSGAPLLCRNKVFGVYKTDHSYNENKEDDEICGKGIYINLFTKLSMSEKDGSFVQRYAAVGQVESKSCYDVAQPYFVISLIWIWLLF